MRIDWIIFHGIYDDSEYTLGREGVRELLIESCVTEPYCRRSQLRIYYDGDVYKVRSLDGANYDFRKAGEEGMSR